MRRVVAWTAMVAVATASLMQAMRVAFPVLYDVREDAGASTAALWAIGAFVLAPAVLALTLVRVRDAFRFAVVALATARLAEQFLHPIPLWLAATSVAVGVTALVLLIMQGRGN